MTIYNTLGVRKKDLKGFESFQKKIFFTKADIPVSDAKLKKQSQRSYISKDRVYVKSVFQGQFDEQPISIIPLSGVTLHRVYKVFLKKNAYIFKINAWGKIYREFNFWKERRIMENLSKKNLPALTIYNLDISRRLVPFDYEIMEVAKGESFFDISKRKKIAPDFHILLGKIVRRVHNIKTNKFGPLNIKGVGIYSSWKNYVYCNFNKHVQKCFKLGYIDKKRLELIREIFSKYDRVFDQVASPSLLHGDLANHNVFTDGKRITAIIDWEDSISGDPIFDIAYFGSGCYSHNDWFEAFSRGYGSSQTLNRDFWLRYWLYFLRISLSKTIARFRFNSHTNPLLPPIKERILYGIENLQLLV